MFKMICVCALAATMAAGCRTTEDYNEPLGGAMSIELRASNRTVAVGDTVTIVSHTQNMVARGTEIQWASTGGELELSDDNRIARVRFDTPGRYTISAQAMHNGAVVDSGSVQIEVRPIQPNTPRLHDGNTQDTLRQQDRDFDDRDFDE